MKKERNTIDTIEIIEIYKTYPKQIENDVPEILSNYYKKNEIRCPRTYRNLISYGGMFTEQKNRGKHLAEFRCSKTNKEWFGGISFDSYDYDEVFIHPTVEKYIEPKTSHNTKEPKLLMIGGIDARYAVPHIKGYEYITFDFYSYNLLDELENHLIKLYSIKNEKKNKSFIVSDWYLRRIYEMVIDKTIYEVFETKEELAEFLKYYEDRIHKIFDFKKLIITYSPCLLVNNIDMKLYSDDPNYPRYARELKRMGLKKVSVTNVYLNLIEKLFDNTYLLESNMNLLHNIEQLTLENNFYLNYYKNLPCNTFYYCIDYGDIDIDEMVENIMDNKKYIDRYSFNDFDYINEVYNDTDEEYFGKDFLYHTSN